MRKLKKVNKRVLIQTVIITVIVFIAALLCIFPFYWMILNAVKNPDLINQGTVDLVTFDLTWESLKSVFTYNNGLIWKAYLNSFIIAIAQTLGTLFTSSLAAFAFAKIKFKGSKPIYGLFIATLMVPGQVTMLPLFMIFAKIGWTNSFLILYPVLKRSSGRLEERCR